MKDGPVVRYQLVAHGSSENKDVRGGCHAKFPRELGGHALVECLERLLAFICRHTCCLCQGIVESGGPSGDYQLEGIVQTTRLLVLEVIRHLEQVLQGKARNSGLIGAEELPENRDEVSLGNNEGSLGNIVGAGCQQFLRGSRSDGEVSLQYVLEDLSELLAYTSRLRKQQGRDSGAMAIPQERGLDHLLEKGGEGRRWVLPRRDNVPRYLLHGKVHTEPFEELLTMTITKFDEEELHVHISSFGQHSEPPTTFDQCVLCRIQFCLLNHVNNVNNVNGVTKLTLTFPLWHNRAAISGA